MKQEKKSAFIVLIAVMMQIVLLRISGAVALIALLASAGAAVTLGGYRPRQLIRTVRGLLMILTAVLVTRLVVEFSLPTLEEWVFYAARLLSAVMIALTAFGMVDTVGIERGLRYLLQPVPVCIRCPVLDLVGSTLFLLPVVSRRFSESGSAARVRLATSRRNAPTRVLFTVRSVLVSIAAIPRQRAEAMVVRGLLSDNGGARTGREADQLDRECGPK